MVSIPIVHTEKKAKVYPYSETSKCRQRLKRFCTGDGVDIGFGGDPIVPSAITIDLPTGPYGVVFGEHPQNIHGDGTNLHWFRDGVLDYVFASHLLEDFSVERIPQIVEEWMRVLKVGGYVVIYCPDEQIYRKYCVDHGTQPNLAHKNLDFGLKFLVNLLEKELKIKYDIVYSLEHDESYGFDLVLKKE